MSDQMHPEDSANVTPPSADLLKGVIEPLFASHSHLADLVDQVTLGGASVDTVRKELRVTASQVDSILQQASRRKAGSYVGKDVMQSAARTLENARLILDGQMPNQSFDSAV